MFNSSMKIPFPPFYLPPFPPSYLPPFPPSYLPPFPTSYLPSIPPSTLLFASMPPPLYQRTFP